MSNHWKQYHGDDKGLEKLTYEPMFHWHGIVNFTIYMTCLVISFLVFRFMVGLI